jgi:hypothetical protein
VLACGKISCNANALAIRTSTRRTLATAIATNDDFDFVAKTFADGGDDRLKGVECGM